MQQAVDDYHKLVQAKEPKSWNDTRTFFIKEDLKATDNFQALSKADIGSVHSAITNERIDQLQSHTTNLINKAVTYEKAMTEMASPISHI